MALASSIHLCSPSTVERPKTRTYIIYYVTGNPGLIEFYRTFLTHLFGLLQERYASSSLPAVDFEIYGRSLPGFEVQAPANPEKADQGQVRGPPYNVQEEIEHSENELKRLVRAARASGKKDVRVIMIGHSLGTYLSMEIMRRLRTEAAAGTDLGEAPIRIVGAVLLFAAIMDLAQSPSGLRAKRIVTLPHFPRLASLVVKALFFLLPVALLTLIIRLGDVPPEQARVTAAFLKSPHGVEQALYLLKDELKEISIDKWDAEIWGAAHASSHPHPRPILRFLFAKTDHWVAQRSRDELIKARGMGQESDELWKPRMEVDETHGWPHDFCTKHSVPVAERVAGYLDEIIQGDLESPADNH